MQWKLGAVAGGLILAAVSMQAAASVQAGGDPAVTRLMITPDSLERFTGFEGSPSSLTPGAASAAGPREGWPVFLGTPGSGFPYTPTLHDIDGDGSDEIFLTGGHTFGLRGDGSFLPGWPTVEMTSMGYGTNGNMPGPSVWDLENDGEVEVLWSTRDWWAGNSYLWCFNGRNRDGSNMTGFPQHAIDQMSNALDVPFVLGDTDGDGDLEAWGPHTLGNAFVYYRLSAFDHLGTRLFTVDLDPAESLLDLYFGDLDGEGHEEMFAVGFRSPSLYLHAFAANGGEQAGYPVLLHTFASGYLPFGPPVPADLDQDGDLEILFGHWDTSGSRIFACHHDGSPCTGFPIPVATSSQLFYFGLGDLTGDGEPELIAFDNHLAGDFRIHAIDIPSAAPLAGWPYPLLHWPEGFPTVADVDDDGLQDVCLVTDGGELLAIAGTGQLIAGYPKMMAASSISGVAAGDIDGDGLFELVAATWNGWVYAWDTPGHALPGRADWPQRGVDSRNTGIFKRGVATAAIPLDPGAESTSLRILRNPVTTQAEFLISRPALASRLEIFDPTGRRVAALDAGMRDRLIWRPERSLAAGVYFARLKAGEETGSIRFVILR